MIESGSYRVLGHLQRTRAPLPRALMLATALVSDAVVEIKDNLKRAHQLT